MFAFKRAAAFGLRRVISVAKVGAVIRYALVHAWPERARVLVRLRGPDAWRFVQGTLTADLDAIPPGTAMASALLTVKGKVVAEAIVLPAAEEAIDLLVPSVVAESTVALLGRHIVMDEVEIEPVVQSGLALVWGDADAEEEAIAAEGMRSFVTRHPAPGRLYVGDPAAVEAALAPLGAPVGFAEYETHRIDTASPAWGHEIQDGVFPPEAGFTYAVSYQKGCFLGQEPLARIHARGQVQRVMVQVELELERELAAPVPLAHEDRADAGTLTTSVARRGLAIVRRAYAHPDASLVASTGEGSVVVHVRSGPLGDDPGTPGRTTRRG